MSYINNLIKKISKTRDPTKLKKLFKEIEKHENYTFNKIQYHSKVIQNEETPRAKYSKGYLRTMKILNGGEFGFKHISKNRKKDFVKNVFIMNKNEPNSNYHRGSVQAIYDFKKHNRKDGLNIYGDPVRKRK